MSRSQVNLTSLQAAFKQCHDKHGRGGTLSKRIMAELSSAMITLNDLELPLEDLRTVGGFLASTVARAELRLIVVRRTVLVAGRGSNSSCKGGPQKQKSKADRGWRRLQRGHDAPLRCKHRALSL